MTVMSDGEPILDSVPMDVVTEKKPESMVMPEKVVKTEAQVMTESRTWDVFTAEEARYFVEQRDNSEAQLAATMLMANLFRVSNKYDLEVIKAIDLTAVADKLSLDQETREIMVKKRADLVVKMSKLPVIRKDYRDIEEKDKDYFRIVYDKTNEEVEEKINELRNLETQTEDDAQVLYRELMLPVRTAVLNSKNMSEDYKKQAIRGINHDNGPLLEPERQLLKDYYPQANEQERRVIIDAVASYIRTDIRSFNIVPVEDLMERGILEKNKVFALVWNNPEITSEVVEKKMAMIFFPEEDPKKVRKCWETLKRVVPYQRVFVDTSLKDSELMSVEIFTYFMKNVEELSPVVEMLADYGFQYQLVTPNVVDQVYPKYIDELKGLGKELPELRQQLDLIKDVLPKYKFNFKADLRWGPDVEPQIDVNPYSLALKYTDDNIETQWDLDKYTDTFNSLETIVPEKWRRGFLTTYINRMSLISYDNSNFELSQAAITEANKWIFDASLTADDVSKFGYRFFKSSLQAKSDNLRVLYEFCTRYADKIPLQESPLNEFDKDSIWWEFALSASDIYRYQLVSGYEEETIKKNKEDLVYAGEAVLQITDPKIKDRAISNLIYALTDEELGNWEKAQFYVDMMQDVRLKQDSQTEVLLELERLSKRESTSWKKMEKLKRTGTKNKLELQQSLGYQSEERIEQLKKEISRIENDFSVTVNITWKNLLKALDKGRLVSIWENKEKMEERRTSGYFKYDYAERRDKIEKEMGNRGKGGIKDPHPIYGAASTPNSRDEFSGGAGGGYGECFVVLKTERIKNRTSFCYDDSFGVYKNWLLDWDGGILAKAIHNLKGVDKASHHGYVEAQILGGVSLDDIESINIPSNATTENNKRGWHAETKDIEADIEKLKQRFPKIKINIIEVPKT